MNKYISECNDILNISEWNFRHDKIFAVAWEQSFMNVDEINE